MTLREEYIKQGCIETKPLTIEDLEEFEEERNKEFTDFLKNPKLVKDYEDAAEQYEFSDKQNAKDLYELEEELNKYDRNR